MSNSDTIWLITLNDKLSAHPIGYGMFDNPVDMTHELWQAGITADAQEISLRNEDGRMAALILNDTDMSATITRVPRDVALTITDLDTELWAVPDSLDGFGLPASDPTAITKPASNPAADDTTEGE
jgi:hypothetical protein